MADETTEKSEEITLETDETIETPEDIEETASDVEEPFDIWKQYEKRAAQNKK